MQPIIFILLLFIVSSCTNSGGSNKTVSPTNYSKNQILPFLNEGTFEVEYYPSKEVTMSQKRLLQRFSTFVESNTKAQDYFLQIENGGSPAYKPGMGLNRNEYKILTDLFAYKEPEKYSGKLTIIRNESNITFQGKGRLSLLDSLRISTDNNTAFFRNYTLRIVKDSSDFSNEFTPPGDSLETPAYFKGPDGIMGLTGLEGAYELVIGKLKPSGRIYMSFFAKQPDMIEHPIPDFITFWINTQ